MPDISAEELARVDSFPKLVALLRDRLEWPIEDNYELEDVTFEYEPKELGLKDDETAKIREIFQLRPLVTNQPWGVFFLSFEEKQLSVTVLRRILKALVVTKRGESKDANRAAWDKSDLIFAANFGKSGERELAFVHFSDGAETGDLPAMKVLGWNAKDTKLHNEYAAKMLTSRLAWPGDESDDKAWRKQWSSAFEIGHRQVIKTSRDLALHLAGLATQIRARANELLEAEAEDGPMRTMLEAFRKNLIHDLDEDGFADMFAQTICYGMLAAAISRESGALVADNMADMVPRTNPFLKELFANFLKIGGRDKRSNLDFDELGVREVVDMLQSADMPAVLRDFGDRNPKEDPVIHFYELFLKEYDPAKRMQRGVFYTPRPVVNFIVRGVDEILRTEFDLPLGLADTTTWGELAERNDKITVPDHIDPEQPFVQILDPATGTGTFLVEVIDLIHKRMVEHWLGEARSEAEIAEAWNEYVPADLLPRLTAFELMMAPYSIAHMKVGLKLTETGYKFGSDERARIFLTNALEPSVALDQQLSFVAEAFAHEAEAANSTKDECFTVVVGNPPYAVSTNNRGHWIESKNADFKRGLEGEINLQPLSDDYLKFLRVASWFIERSGCGVVSLISNREYVDGLLHRAVRRYLFHAFEYGEITDLGGQVGALNQHNQDDENVFAIRKGVAICLLVSGASNPGWSYRRLFGTSEEKGDQLLNGPLPQLAETEPHADRWYFSPQGDRDPCYDAWPSLTELFESSPTTGFATHRDHFALAFTKDELENRISGFSDLEISDTQIAARYSLKDTRDWKLHLARRRVAADDKGSECYTECSYRPFDTRNVYYSDYVLEYSRRSAMAGIAEGKPALIASRIVKNEIYAHVMVSEQPVEKIYLSPKSSNNAQVFPISRQIEGGLENEISNISQRFLRRLEKIVGNDVADQEIFDWIYAILHAPSYRSRYAEFLKSDFPRIPIPKDRDTFAALVPLGRRLVGLHLLKPKEEPVLKNPDIRFAGTGEARVEKGYPKYRNGKVEINANRWFEDVPKATWDFHVGGYQVCDKWLKDRAGNGGKNPRPGRVLSDEDILHYRRVVTALTETRKVMTDIDQAIENHGGWPDAFYCDDESEPR